jgi:predicted glycosyltransferase
MQSSRANSTKLAAWVDIENPPQVQYLGSIVEGLRERGLEVLVTARNYGDTFALLEARGVEYVPVARHFGAAKLAKVSGTLRRVWTLHRLLRTRGRPDFLVSASRSAALAARWASVPSFALCDYEYVNLAVFRVTGSLIVHPSVIAVESFVRRGVPADQLMPYVGIKEDITFADVDIDATPAHRFPELDNTGLVKLLLRPPAEESHYHRASSSKTLLRVLEWLSSRTDIVTIYSPRYHWQKDQLNTLAWQRPPVVLDQPVDSVPLYKGVDIVLTGGGTMAREAAYLGVPALTIFQGALGDVDRHLESLGRIRVVTDEDDLERLDLGNIGRLPPLRTNPSARDDMINAMLATARRAGPRRSAN